MTRQLVHPEVAIVQEYERISDIVASYIELKGYNASMAIWTREGSRSINDA